MRVELHPEARSELHRAALWYEEQREGLGGEFIAEVPSALERIGHAPQSFPPWPQLTGRTPLIRRYLCLLLRLSWGYVVGFASWQEFAHPWNNEAIVEKLPKVAGSGRIIRSPCSKSSSRT